MDPIKKENLVQKDFSDNFEWSYKKLWKIISGAAWAYTKQQEIKELVAVSYKFLWER